MSWNRLVPTGTDQFMPGVQWVFVNKKYTVAARPHSKGEVLWLSIRRNDRKRIDDWRDVQLVKNEIAGPESDAFQIFPKESRLKDGANQYHLYCLPEGETIPCGMSEGRAVTDLNNKEERDSFRREAEQEGIPAERIDKILSKVKQRPFEKHHQPDNVPDHGWITWEENSGWSAPFSLENINGNCVLEMYPELMTDYQLKLLPGMLGEYDDRS